MVQIFTNKVQGVDAEALSQAIEPILLAHHVQTAEITHQREQGGWVLRVTVEALEGGQASGSPPSNGERAPVAAEAMGDDRATAETGDADQAQIAPPPGGIELGLLTEISRDLSTALDVADLIPHRYTLEVSSPGLERPLRSLRDFQQAVGVMAKIHLSRPAADGQRVLRGRVLRVEDPEAVVIEVDGNPISAPFTDISRAHTLYELPAQPKRNRATKNKRH
jgi:ribosome maturation factor RimP